MAIEILSLGDAQFLKDTLNAMAMITQSQAFHNLSAAGFILGVMYVAIQSAMGGTKEFNISSIFIAAIIWLAFFSTTKTVIVKDVRTGTPYSVGHVPTGVAYSGMIISQVGEGLTSLFETGYSRPEITQKGFADEITTMRAVGELTVKGTDPVDTNHKPLSDREEALTQYYTNCLSFDLGHKAKILSQLYAANDFLTAIQSTTVTSTTYVNLTGTPPAFYDCHLAWGFIKNDLLSSQFQGAIYKQLAANTGQSVAEAQIRVQNLVDTLNARGGATTITATTYILNNVLKNALPDAAIAKSILSNNNNYQIMINQATNQRLVQWQSDKDNWTLISKPLMTFFEAAMYAVTPILGFILAFGAAGYGLLAAYFKFAMWIQLWYPVMAIINFFILSAFEGHLDTLTATGGMSLASINGLFTTDQIAVTWYQTGSMLIAITPVITLMLIYGGTQAAASLAGNLRGRDFVNEKIVSPDSIQPAPYVQNIAPVSHSIVNGDFATDPVGGGSMTINKMHSNATQSLSTYSKGSTENLGATAAKMIATNYTVGQAGSRTIGSSHNTNAGYSQDISASLAKSVNNAIGMGNKTNLTEKQSSAVAIAGAEILNILTGGKRDADGELSKEEQTKVKSIGNSLASFLPKISTSSDKTSSIMSDFNASVKEMESNTSGVEAKLGENLIKSTAYNSTDNASNSTSGGFNQSLSKAVNKTRSHIEQYSKTASNSSSVGNSVSIRKSRLANNLSSEWSRSADKLIGKNNLGADVNKRIQQLRASSWGQVLSSDSVTKLAQFESLYDWTENYEHEHPEESMTPSRSHVNAGYNEVERENVLKTMDNSENNRNLKNKPVINPNENRAIKQADDDKIKPIRSNINSLKKTANNNIGKVDNQSRNANPTEAYSGFKNKVEATGVSAYAKTYQKNHEAMVNAIANINDEGGVNRVVNSLPQFGHALYDSIPNFAHRTGEIIGGMTWDAAHGKLTFAQAGKDIQLAHGLYDQKMKEFKNRGLNENQASAFASLVSGYIPPEEIQQWKDTHNGQYKPNMVTLGDPVVNRLADAAAPYSTMINNALMKEDNPVIGDDRSIIAQKFGLNLNNPRDRKVWENLSDMAAIGDSQIENIYKAMVIPQQIKFPDISKQK